MKIKKPNFFIIGGPKCGTTSLSKYLGEHPNIFFSKPKEPHYFATDCLENVRFATTKEEYLNLFQGSAGYKAVGEGSTYYLQSKEAVPNILKFNSEAKFIVIVRNPVEMAYSLYSQKLSSLDENVYDFEKAWNLQKERRKGKFIPDTCRDPLFLQYGKICKQGEQIKRLFENVSDKSRIKVIKFTNFTENTKEVYKEVLDFLEVKKDGRKNFHVYKKNNKLRSRVFKRFLISLRKGPAGKISGYVKDKIHIQYWPWFVGIDKLNEKKVKRKPLKESFKKRLKDYFKEDQKILKKTLNQFNK